MRRLCLAAVVLAVGWFQARATASEPPVPYPHPMICEVHFAVPTGDGGDASGDGTRHVSGDEFIELINPHERPIEVRGYTITDRNPASRGQVRFEFPRLTLAPGQVVVVFNGNGQDWGKLGGVGSAVGDASRGPKEGNERFAGALVLTMGITSQREAWANGGDYALLTSPKGEAVQCVRWGSYDVPTPEALVVHEAPECSGSVQWDPDAGAFAAHESIDGRLFSPGEFTLPGAPVAAEPEAPPAVEPPPQPAGKKPSPPEVVGPMPLQDPAFVGPPHFE